MKVKCIKIINPITNQVEDRSNWLTIGRTYIVLAILVPFEKKASYICLSDDNSTPIKFDIEQFNIICNKIPSNWRTSLDESGNLSFAPDKWLRNEFWIDYFDSNESAVEDFNVEVNRILSESI